MKTVTIYTTPTCGWCKMTKEYFREHNVEFSEKDVSTDHAAAKEMIDKSSQLGVPVITVADAGKEEIIIGFDEERLSEVLGINA